MTRSLTEDEFKAVIQNPFYAITIDPQFAEPHPTLVTEAIWIKANIRLINELGPEQYLRQLLAVLKGERWVEG